MGKPVPKEFYRFVEELCRVSGEIIRDYFHRPDLQVEQKADASPVTRADREAEAAIRERIRRGYPDHGIIGEEYGEENPGAEFVWVLDPIDGTKTFIHGCPLFGTLIGLLHQGEPVLGAIHLPVLNQLCMGDNSRTTLNGRAVGVRRRRDLAQATVLATDITNVARYQQEAGFQRLVKQCRLFRTWGDCYGYVLLAAGHADVMLDPIMNPWDMLPLIPVIRGAGGVITTWQGDDPTRGDSCVAAGKELHPLVVEMLNSYTPQG